MEEGHSPLSIAFDEHAPLRSGACGSVLSCVNADAIVASDKLNKVFIVKLGIACQQLGQGRYNYRAARTRASSCINV